MLKELKYVQEGLLSDPPGMNMYRQIGMFKCSGRLKYRSLRNTSPLEGSFLHWRASRHPTAKGAGPKSTQIHTNMWDFNWSLNAAAAANLMRTIHHHQPWLIDAIAHTCRGWLPDDELPPIVQNWACIDTTIAPCTFRGMDWEVQSTSSLTLTLTLTLTLNRNSNPKPKPKPKPNPTPNPNPNPTLTPTLTLTLTLAHGPNPNPNPWP